MPARPTRLLDRPDVGAEDVLSDVLRTVRLAGALFFRVEAAAPWCSTAPAGGVLAKVILPASEQVISYHVITAGSCWANLEPGREFHLETGDIVVFPHGDPYSLATRRGMHGELDLDFFRQMAAGRLPFTIREGAKATPDIQVLCGFLCCDVQPYNPLLATLPPVIVVHGSRAAESGRLSGIIELARAEAADVHPGSACVLARLSELLFIEAVRQYVRDASPDRTSWLSGLRDEVVGRALALLHEDLARRWTLERLARKVGVSRSGLVTRFSEFVGEPPMQYLTRWRMQKAAHELAEGRKKVAAVALQTGYDSEAAFSRAFKRLVGVPPAEWRRQRGRPTSRS